MGKVLVNGHAEQEYAPDYCEISLSVEVEGKTAAKAISATMIEFERLISKLSEMGFKPENMIITDDSSKKPYRRNEDDYTANKAVRLHIPVDIALVNRIHDLIASGFENTTIGVNYDISSRTERMRELTKLAIQDSRKTADLLAEATGTKVTGIEAANLDGDEDMDMDIASLDLEVIDEHRETIHRCCGSGIDTPFSDKLIPEKISMETDVRIVWTLE